MKEALEQELVNFAKEIIAHQGQLNISKMRQQALRLTDKITILGFVEKYYQILKASEERMLYTMRKVASFIEEHQEEDIFNIDTDVTEIEPLNIQFQKEEAAPLAFVAMEPAPITKQSAPAPAAAQQTPPPAFTAPAAPPQPQQHTEPASAPAPAAAQQTPPAFTAPAAQPQPQQHTEPAPAPSPAAAQQTPPPAFTAPAAQPQPQQHTEPAPAPAPAAAQQTPPPAFTAPAAAPQPQQHTEPAPAPAPAAAQQTPPPAFTAPAAQPQPQQHTEPAPAPAAAQPTPPPAFTAPATAQPTPPPAFTAPAAQPQPQQHTEPAPYREPLYSIHAKQDPRDETEEEQEARIEKVLQHVFEATQAFIPEAMKYKPFPQEEEEESVAHEPKDFPTEPEAQPFFAAAAKPATPVSTPTAPPPASVAKEPEKPHNHNPFEAMAEQFIQQHVQEQAAQQKQQQAAQQMQQMQQQAPQQMQQMQQQAAQQHLHEQMQHNHSFGTNNATPNTPFGQPTAAPAAQPQPLENPFAATANQDNVKTSWAMNIDQPSSQNIAQPQPAARQTPSLEEFLSQKAKTASFERKNPEETKPTQSLNDRFSKAIQIGLNDKLAFVQKLFFGSESEYNKVLKHLEELHTLEEAAVYIQQQVKPTYNHWKGKEEYEERFLSLILRRFE